MDDKKIDETLYAPGTLVERTPGQDSVFAQFDSMIRITNGLALGQVCAITGLDTFAIQNWVKRGFVAHPIAKKYYGRQLARIMLINALRDSMKIDNVGKLMEAVNGDTEDESDDIISEERFYDHLCRAFDACEHMIFVEDISGTVRAIVDKYEPGIGEDPKKRLTDALCTMVYAYAAGILIRKNNVYFNELTK